uniref:Uncharacterized protein n=1 Tax=Anopheles funestus TaxID=62324 RepID=A0A182S100_ANOFN
MKHLKIVILFVIFVIMGIVGSEEIDVTTTKVDPSPVVTQRYTPLYPCEDSVGVIRECPP